MYCNVNLELLTKSINSALLVCELRHVNLVDGVYEYDMLLRHVLACLM